MTDDPLATLAFWFAEERHAGNPFAHGAVLATSGKDGMPRSRMLGVSFDDENQPRFHTAPGSRKNEDIAHCAFASLMFAF